MTPALGFMILQAGSAVAGGLAKRSEAMSESARMESEARLADTQALQRDTQARNELSRFLSGVTAARAANGLSATSPNAQILMGEATKVSDDERLVNRANDRQRAANFRTAAKSARSSARWSLVTGLANAAVPLAQYKMNKGS